MAAIEAAIAKIFIDVAISTGIDVVSKRSTNPLIKGAGATYKVFTLISTIDGAYEAIRICAYTDAAQLIAQDAIVEVGSKPIVKALLQLQQTNYEVHRKAEKYLLTPEFAEAKETSGSLGHWLYNNQNFPTDDMTGFGRPLAAQTSVCVARAARARDIAVELSNYPEAFVERREYDWARPENPVGRLNRRLGHILWQPAPEIGLGKRKLWNDSTYFGIFRLNEAEGYGCVAWSDGTRYYGQTRHGQPCGYGAIYRPDGLAYFGKVGDTYRQLGASISPVRDWIYYGEHEGITPDGYGRRVGRANGIESIVGIWSHGKIAVPFKTFAAIHRSISEGMTGPYIEDLRLEYAQRADHADQSLKSNDISVISHLDGRV